MSSFEGRSVTTFDIARKAGVSRATVGIVLRGEARQRKISSETVDRVLAIAKDLNYVPNPFARNLRRRRSGTIGVVFGNFKADWVESLMQGMLDVLHATDYTPFVAIHRGDPTLAERELQSCLRRADEGIIWLPLPVKAGLYERIHRANIPMVFLGDRPHDMPGVSLVGWDSAAAATRAVEHLVATGRRRIAYVGIDYPMVLAEARRQAFVDVVARAGLPLSERWVVSAPTTWALDRIMSWTLEWMFAPGEEHPDAIFAVNDGLAIGLLETLDARGIRVPEDVAVIGMGDYPMTGHSAISLSTVREPCREMGYEAARLMLELIAAPEKGPVERLIPGDELKVRRTTAPRVREPQSKR